jgi:dihydrolipoamide dehydrogenase
MAGTSVETVDTSGAGCKVTTKAKKDGAIEVIDCDIVLSAAGVTPNTENIGLEMLGIKTERGFITVDDRYQTNIAGIYAIGDVLPTQALAHVASAEGITCVEGTLIKLIITISPAVRIARPKFHRSVIPKKARKTLVLT